MDADALLPTMELQENKGDTVVQFRELDEGWKGDIAKTVSNIM